MRYRQTSDRRFRRTAIGAAIAVGSLLALALAVPALAHIERASYWPDPAPDTSVNPPAGGAVPQVRSVFTALDKGQRGTTRVVCQGTAVPLPKYKSLRKLRKHRRKAAKQGLTAKVAKLSKKIKKVKKANRAKRTAYEKKLKKNPSMQALDASIAATEASGYKLRPTGDVISVSKGEGKQLRKMNERLLADCKYNSIQDAVTASGNNDRVEVMPGIYTEPKSRAQPTNDPACASLKETNDKGSTGAVSYKYQTKCPNDQNLIAVIGRGPSSTPVPQPPALDRHGIPDNGPCIRCNMQIEGTGVTPDDVTVDAGRVASGDGAPINPVKDVGIRIDRADGFVLNNIKVRHATEHDVYAIETDGFQLNRLKTPYAGEYGVLTFVADHSLIQNCDAWGNGDSGLYPGAAADLGDAVPPAQRRYGTEIRNCDSHHNAGGYSGTDGNAVWVHNNNFYDNTLGFTTDVFTAPGHPGFPQDSDLIENNNFYNNNFNTYLPPCPAGVKPGPAVPGQTAGSPGGNCSDVVPTVPVPVGTGMWIAGGNHNVIRNNHFWDNWRRGTMLYAVPDQLVCGPTGIDPSQLAGCDPTHVPPSTSYNNQYYGNVMGKTPSGASSPNGVDFWWDGFLANTGNCWHNNGTYTSSPPPSPLAGASIPGFLPEDCATSIGTTVANAGNEVELLNCFANISGLPNTCDWFTTPPKP